MTSTFQKLQEAEAKAKQLFQAVEHRKIIVPNQSEETINTAIFNLAFELFGIKKYWHKRIVRAGKNTLSPYAENPPNLVLTEDDIVFLDFGPIFEAWEADLGRTYVLGNNPHKLKLKHDVEAAWYDVKTWFDQQTKITGAEIYRHTASVAHQYGWQLGGEIAGHIIGQFPHEKIKSDEQSLYFHPNNTHDVFQLDKNGMPRHWILELFFVDKKQEIGGFFEQLLV